MFNVFNCNLTLANTGFGCTPIIRVAKKLIFVSYYDSTGAVNTILNSATLNKAFFDALLNNADRTKRWYPLPFLKNAKNEREASILEGFDDNSNIVVQQGIRKFMGLIVERDATPQLTGKILSFRSREVGCYIIDKDDNLIGVLNTAGQLDPIRIDENSLDPIYNPSEDKTVAKIALTFNFHVNEVDANIRMIAANEFSSYSISSALGLLDITPVFSALSHLGTFTLELDTDFGTPKNPVTDKGLVIADFISAVTAATSKFRNITSGADVAITSVTEKTDGAGNKLGIYDFVFPAQTANDVIQVSATKNGRDYSALAAARPVLI